MHGMSIIGLLILLLLIIFTVSYVGGNIGLDTQINTNSNVITSPDIFSQLQWAFNSMEFYLNLSTFQVPNMPLALSMIFSLINILTIFVIILVIRGTG